LYEQIRQYCYSDSANHSEKWNRPNRGNQPNC
jgi:hypothetical protein